MGKRQKSKKNTFRSLPINLDVFHRSSLEESDKENRQFLFLLSDIKRYKNGGGVKN
jgi:hypothetical protein